MHHDATVQNSTAINPCPITWGMPSLLPETLSLWKKKKPAGISSRSIKNVNLKVDGFITYYNQKSSHNLTWRCSEREADEYRSRMSDVRIATPSLNVCLERILIWSSAKCLWIEIPPLPYATSLRPALIIILDWRMSSFSQCEGYLSHSKPPHFFLRIQKANCLRFRSQRLLSGLPCQDPIR